MRKTLATLALIVAVGLTAAGCSDSPDTDTAAPSPAVSASESAGMGTVEPSGLYDPAKDVTAVVASPASVAKYPERNAINLDFTVTNHGPVAATYAVTFAVFDSTGAQVGAALVDTGNSGYGPTKPGAVLKVKTVGLMDGNTVPDVFTVRVQSVETTPAA